MSHAKKFVSNDADRAKALELFCSAPKEVPPSNVRELPKSTKPRWTKKRNANGGWDVSDGKTSRHFETHDEADVFLDQMTFPERFGK